MSNPIFSRILPAPRHGGFRMDDYFIWCGSVVKGEDGRYHMFASRWRRELGFGWQWLFNCEIVRAVSDDPIGPYSFAEVVFQRRERHYFDALNQHNPSIKFWNGTYYLYCFDGVSWNMVIPLAPAQSGQVADEKMALVLGTSTISGQVDMSASLTEKDLTADDTPFRRPRC